MWKKRDRLTALDRVAGGGDAFRDWAAELLASDLAELERVCAGGLVVPQVGEQAGEGIGFRLAGTDNCLDESLKTLILDESERLGASCWDSPSFGASRFSLSCSAEPQFVCIIVPISFLFDRPVGYFWVTTSESVAEAAEAALDCAVRFFAIVVRAEMAWSALKELAQPVWKDAATTQSTALEVGRACKRALACSAVIIWETHRPSQILKTLAVIGAPRAPQLDMHLGAGIAGTCAVDSRVLVIDDFHDPQILQDLALPSPTHGEVIQQQGWKSGVFVPLDVGGRIAGVLAVLASRARAFAEIDKKIAEAFAQRLCAAYVHGDRLKELMDMESRIAMEAPAIEAGMQAMERIHDADNSIFLAQSALSSITARFRNTRSHPINKAAIDASSHIDSAHKVVRSLVRRAKLKDPVFSSKLLSDLLSAVVGEFRNRAQGLGVSLYLRCSPTLKIKMDVEQMQRVFANIVDNALYFLETDRKAGEKKIEISAVPNPPRAIITVKDTGPGIPPYSLEKIFDYFYTTRGARGMGFGLAIARGIIQTHGGIIRARSRFGYETEFIIDLPLLSE